MPTTSAPTEHDYGAQPTGSAQPMTKSAHSPPTPALKPGNKKKLKTNYYTHTSKQHSSDQQSESEDIFDFPGFPREYESDEEVNLDTSPEVRTVNRQNRSDGKPLRATKKTNEQKFERQCKVDHDRKAKRQADTLERAMLKNFETYPEHIKKPHSNPCEESKAINEIIKIQHMKLDTADQKKLPALFAKLHSQYSCQWDLVYKHLCIGLGLTDVLQASTLDDADKEIKSLKEKIDELEKALAAERSKVKLLRESLLVAYHEQATQKQKLHEMNMLARQVSDKYKISCNRLQAYQLKHDYKQDLEMLDYQLDDHLLAGTELKGGKTSDRGTQTIMTDRPYFVRKALAERTCRQFEQWLIRIRQSYIDNTKMEADRVDRTWKFYQEMVDGRDIDYKALAGISNQWCAGVDD